MSAPPPAAAEVLTGTGPAVPLTPAELAARLAVFAPYEARPRLAVAVSGGADSLALALLAHGWARRQGGAVLALIVDHGLRAGSAAEAAQVAGWLAAHDIRSVLLAWTGAKPATGIQAAARAARYALLEEACRQRSLLHLLLAHHADDQAETVAMRAERGSGGIGLAGMAAVVERPGLRLLRPLLDLPKARLAATLRALGQPWLEDPSNRAERFHRGRLRLDHGFDGPARWRQGAVHASERAAVDAELAAFFARHARPHPLGQVALRLTGLEALPSASRALALRRSLQAVAGNGYAGGDVPPIPSGGRATCGGCVLEHRGGWLRLAREPARIADRRLLPPGGTHFWDGRFLVCFQAGPTPLELAPLGEAGRRRLAPALRAQLRETGISTFAVAALPALRRGDALIACPPLVSAAAPCRVETSLRPRVALCAAAFCGVNVVSNHHRPIYRVSLGERAVSGTPGFVPR